MVSLKKIPKKLIAVLLAVILVISVIPVSVFSVFAQQVDKFTVVLENYNKTAIVTLTQSDDSTVTETITAENGKAVFENFYDDEKLYNLLITDLIGYEDYQVSLFTIENNLFTVHNLVEIDKITISGTVVDENSDAVPNVNVAYSAYDGTINDDITTDSNGRYSFEAYSGIKYDLTITGDDKYEVRNATVKETADKDLGTQQLQVKQFAITTVLGTNGYVDNDIVTVCYGENAPSIIVKADENYRIDKLIINGKNIEAAVGEESYDISKNIKNVKEKYDVSATFYRPTYEITINYNSNGEVKDNSDNPVSNGGKVILEQGSTAGFTAIPAENYHIGNVSIDGDDINESWSNDYGNYSHTFNDNKKHSVTISFAVNTYKVDVKAKDNNGTITASETIVDWNNQSTISIIPNVNFDIDTFSISTHSSVNLDSLIENEDGTYVYTLSNITENIDVEVSFKEIEVNVPEDKLNNAFYSITFSKEPVVIGNDYIVADGESITISTNEESEYQRVRINRSSNKGSSVTFSNDTEINTIDVSKNLIAGWNRSVNVGINFKIDSDGPVVSNVTKKPNVDYNNASYLITANVIDNLSGVDKVLYSTNKDLSNANEAKFDGKIAEFTTTNDEYNGIYYIWAIDKVGNISKPETIEIKIDKTAPSIKSIVLNGDGLKATEFGTFCNNDIVVTVKADDENSLVAKSGVDTVTLFIDGKKYSTENISNDGTVEFILTNSESFDFTEGKSISVSAKDNAGNECNKISLSDIEESTNKVSDKVFITTVIPTVEIKIDDNGAFDGLVRYDENESTVWFNRDNNFTINIKDKNAIQNVIVKLNGEEIDTTSNGIKLKNFDFTSDGIADTELQLIVNTSQFIDTVTGNSKDGENVLEVTVINVSQNKNNPNPKEQSVFIDTTNPEIIGFEFNKSESFKDKLLHILSFGKYSNAQVEITVNANDDNASSGIKNISLYKREAITNDSKEELVATASFVESETTLNDNINPTIVKNNDGTYSATFILPESAMNAEDEYFNALLSAKAVDYVNNETDNFVYVNTENSPSFADSGLMIETIKPTICDVDFPTPASSKNQATADNNDWYSDDIDMTFIAEDGNAGLRSVIIKVNGKSLIEDTELYKEKTYTETYTINTQDAEIGQNGEYVITAEVIDNAGNVSKPYTKTVYKDIDNPAVIDFKFNATGYHNDNKVDKNEGANQAPVQEMSYGYYFIEDTDVTITAKDTGADDKIPTSGIKSITYYTVDKDGGKSEEITKLVDENNKITFTIPANFKGQIYAKATDNVDNTPDEFINPNSIIVESPAQHEKTSSIKYTVKDTEYKDSNGNNLYVNNTTVDVEIVDSYSGIRQIDWKIVSPYDDKNQAGTVTVSNDGVVTSKANEGYSADCLGKWNVTTEDNLVTVLKNTITVSNDSNNIQIKFTLTDRAGNVTKDVVQTLSIDKTAPKIVVQMNENDDDTYSGFFKVDRIADIYVYERNFRTEDFNFVVSRVDDNNSKSNINIEPKFTKVDETVIDGVECYVYKMSHKFTEDGDYSFAVNAKDYVGNSIDDNGVRYSNDKTTDYTVQNNANKAIDNQFTIDHTSPVVKVTYDNNNVINGKYYNTYRTATITVTEHNFTSADNRIVYTRTSNRDGQAIETPSVSSWSQNGNVHIATIRYAADGDYTFGIDITDKAGNEIKDENVSYPNGRDTSKDFTIDTTITKPTIGGVENGMSYKEKVIPTIFIDDVNYASSTVELFRTRKDEINLNVTDQYIVNKPENRNKVSEDTFEKIQENDGVYTLNVSVTDLAGNTSSDSVTFTVNRFGSVYEFSSDLVDLKNAYVKEVTGNIVITEYNPDRLVADSLKVQITRDGAPVNDVKYTVNPVVNNTVAIGSSGWYQYDYVFDNSNFVVDGIYTVTVASEDTVGNKPQSTNDSDLMFRVDSTPPEVVSIKGLENKIVNATDQKVEYQIMDAIGLKSIVVSVDNIAQEPITEFENVSNYSGSFIVPEGLEHDVKIVITDLAGNVTDTSSDTFKPTFEFNNVITVSTNVLIRWYADKPVFWGTIAGMVVVTGVVIFLIAKKKKNNDEDTKSKA